MTKTVTFQVNGESCGAIYGAHLLLRHQKQGKQITAAITNADGLAKIGIDFKQPSALVITALNHMPQVLSLGEIREPQGWEDEAQEIVLQDLSSADDHRGWWHELLGIRRIDPDAGKGMTIGVIDSGCCKHPDFNPNRLEDCGCVIQGEHWQDSSGLDKEGHGTGVIGLIGGAPNDAIFYAGVAPGARILSIKAFDEELDKKKKTGTESEIDRAIFYLIQRGVDLINCSFEVGVDLESTGELIEEAYEKGILCVCAAGNHRVTAFPARHPKAIAVSAIGMGRHTLGNRLLETCAPQPHHETPLWKEDLFLAAFSGRGSEIACCAPGVSVITTAIPRYGHSSAYQIVYGTSFAAPLACGLLASLLWNDAAYHNLPRSIKRSEYARRKLQDICVSVGLPVEFEGKGLIKLPTP